MTTTILTSTIGADGVLHVTVPFSPADANLQVKVIIEKQAPKAADMSPGQWRAWVEANAGRWQGEFERPPQGEYEVREPLE